MPPPSSFPQHVPSAAQPLSGPTVHVPSTWAISPNPYASPHALPRAIASQAPQLPGPSHPIPPPSGVLGYTPNHAHYPSECDRWAQRAYCAPPVETITIDITAMYEGGPKKGCLHGTTFGSICEGRQDIDARITAPELVTIALKVIVPSIKAFCLSFPWWEDEFVVCDECWVNLTKVDYPLEPYFYSKCFVPASCKNTKNMVFKSKKISLYVVVPEAQWFEYEAFIEKDHDDTHSVPPTLPSRPPSSKHVSHIHSSSIVSNTTPSTMGASMRPLDVARTRSNVTSPLFLPMDPCTNFARRAPRLMTMTTGSSIDNSWFEKPLSMDLVGAGTHPGPSIPLGTKPVTATPSMKRGHSHTSSASSITTKSPPTKRALSSALDLCSPDCTHLKEALKSGGAANLDIKKVLKVMREPIEFYPIPTCAITEILANPHKRSFNIENMTLLTGQLRLNTVIEGIVGIGGFKTAQLAQMILSTPPSSGLGSQPCHDIIAKRPYICKEGRPGASGPPYSRFNTPDELEKNFREGNVLYWAKALLKLTYDVIDRAVT
ncbi:hypothetical protein PAXRUDRAFT_19321 [Paxillus rubicundulus Ve08.2h10]|uniref:Uncharacterized protein n=1 Tax=Paxillus rubicundulus Ve08.2h10 TaxID=930991 RepID=A0A0D0CIP3_9AGAM|nr:hypothetical protein PAXRUDRAFT_19321 [Paxillus rubicundulus Ve08.2h10]